MRSKSSSASEVTTVWRYRNSIIIIIIIIIKCHSLPMKLNDLKIISANGTANFLSSTQLEIIEHFSADVN